MTPELGRVHRRDERHLVGLTQGVARPCTEPVVRVHDVGLPRQDRRAELRELVVAGDHLRQRVVGRHPRQIDVRPQDAHSLELGVVGRVRVGAGEHHDLVAGPGHRRCEPVDVGGQPADDERWVLPADHRDAHERPTLPGRRGMLRGCSEPPTSPPSSRESWPASTVRPTMS